MKTRSELEELEQLRHETGLLGDALQAAFANRTQSSKSDFRVKSTNPNSIVDHIKRMRQAVFDSREQRGVDTSDLDMTFADLERFKYKSGKLQ